jgi:hypothetical protein
VVVQEEAEELNPLAEDQATRMSLRPLDVVQIHPHPIPMPFKVAVVVEVGTAEVLEGRLVVAVVVAPAM